MTTAPDCTHFLGSLACDNPDEHKGDGLGCTHSAPWAPDRHTQEVSDD